MKAIIKRNLPLNVKYNLIDKTYISLIDSSGCICDNCNKLIANIATVKNENNQSFTIGFDCLETILLNNNLLDNKSIEQFNHFKKHLPSYIRSAKKIVSDFIDLNKHLSFESIKFETTDFKKWISFGGTKTWFTFHYVYNGGKCYNSGFKMNNDININDFFSVVESISKLQITQI